jgi:hypothetical protein
MVVIDQETINLRRIKKIDIKRDRAISTKGVSKAIADINILHQMDYLLLILVIKFNKSH